MYMPSLKPIPLICNSDSRLKQLWFWITATRKWKFDEDYIIHYRKQNKYIYIPKGFRINGPSIPKIGYTIYNPVGILFLGSMPHDFGYKYNGLLVLDINTKQLHLEVYTKDELDIIFNDINIQFNNLPHITNCAYVALKLFGFFAWNKHRKANRYFISDYPEYLTDFKLPKSIESKFCRGKNDIKLKNV